MRGEHSVRQRRPGGAAAHKPHQEQALSAARRSQRTPFKIKTEFNDQSLRKKLGNAIACIVAHAHVVCQHCDSNTYLFAGWCQSSLDNFTSLIEINAMYRAAP